MLDPNVKKKRIQLKFYNIFITTVPKAKKCFKRKNYQVPQPKVIIDNVSGAVNPGQFLSIIGASGN